MALRQEEFTSLCDDVDLDRDRALVERCQSGDTAAFGNLYARYYERLLRFCLRRLSDRHEAEDAAEEAFARAWKALPNFAGERRFYPWLTVIAGNICTDMLRRRSRSTPTDDLELGTHQPIGSGGSDTAEEMLIASVDGDLVNKALDRLSVRHRHVLAMREGSGWTYQQIADHEGVEIGTIETLLWRARQALKRELTVLSESKGAFAGFLLGLGALIRKGFLRAAHRSSTVSPSGGSGALRNAVAGVAVTSAAVAAAIITPHAFTASRPAAPVPLSGPAAAAAAIAGPGLPFITKGAATAGGGATLLSSGGTGFGGTDFVGSGSGGTGSTAPLLSTLGSVSTSAGQLLGSGNSTGSFGTGILSIPGLPGVAIAGLGSPSSGLTQTLLGSDGSGLSGTVAGALPTITGALPTTITGALPTTIVGALPTTILGAVPTVTGALPTPVTGALPTVTSVLPTVTGALPTTITGALPTTIIGAVPTITTTATTVVPPAVTSGVTKTVGGLTSTLGLGALTPASGSSPSTSGSNTAPTTAPTTTTTTTATPPPSTPPVVSGITKTVTSTLNNLLG